MPTSDLPASTSRCEMLRGGAKTSMPALPAPAAGATCLCLGFVLRKPSSTELSKELSDAGRGRSAAQSPGCEFSRHPCQEQRSHLLLLLTRKTLTGSRDIASFISEDSADNLGERSPFLMPALFPPLAIYQREFAFQHGLISNMLKPKRAIRGGTNFQLKSTEKCR